MVKLFSFLFTLLFSLNVYASGWFVSLPENSETFVKTNFPNATVSHKERDDDEYEVILTDGTEINFFLNGDWKKVDGNFHPLPDAVIPTEVMDTVKRMYPDVSVIEIKKEYYGYEVKLTNRMELEIDNKGKFLRQKYDD